MFSVTVCFGPTGTLWNFLFKTEEKAQGIYNSYVDHKVNNAEFGCLIGTDDFGQAFAFDLPLINGVMLENLDESQQGQIERALHNARSQGKAQQRAAGDPTIRAAMMTQGPAVQSPFPNGRFNG